MHSYCDKNCSTIFSLFQYYLSKNSHHSSAVLIKIAELPTFYKTLEEFN